MSRITVNEHLDHTIVRDIPYQNYHKHQDKYCLDLFLPRTFFCPSKEQIQKIFSTGYPIHHGQGVTNDSCSLLEPTSALCHGQVAPTFSDGKAWPRPPPVVLFVHGGGWQRGCRRAWTYFGGSINLLLCFTTWFFGLYHNVGASLACRGVACAVISYPLTRPAMPWVILDVIVSYTGSAIFSFIVYQLISTSCFISHEIYSFLMQCENVLMFDAECLERTNCIFNVPLSSVFIFTNYLTLLAMLICSCNNPLKDIHPLGARLLWTTVSFLLAHLSSTVGSETAVYTYLCTFLLCVSIQLHSARQWQPVSNSQQIRAITTAMKWIKNCSERTSYFDSTSLFLMGHSAGGQLVSQLALDKNQLDDGGCSSHDIKGVVSISGVYDLQKLSSPVLRRLYLHPAFGPHPDNWLQASPLTLISQPIDGRCCPPFLLLTAQIDGHLNNDADEFYKKLKLRNVTVMKYIIPSTMHLTIMACFSVFQSSVCQRCVDFIKDNAS
ncbi:uncharacterized protein [Haliotis cracherodii]|uniref:uncharacterized protein n=1 Tax=Haliotis cracherodii TaxID=6455 RepID=UPI0039E88039